MWQGTTRPNTNWAGARMAFLNWEHRLEKDPKLKEAFHWAIKTWCERDFIQKTTHKINEMDEQYFLTCFMVLKEGQPIEKGRLVVNGARNFGGKCLNDYLEVGPNLMNDLSDILLLLRRQKWVVCCDMQNMFLNIKVTPKDRRFLRLFYRPHTGVELEVYEFTVHVFGLASSPCVAMRVVREHASRQKERWPLAEEALRSFSLVDDVWFASSDPERLKKCIKEIVDLTGSMGIQVHKWGSNKEELIRDFPMEQRAKTFQLNLEGQAAMKALGIAWDTQTDEFRFVQGPPKKEIWTLRTMSSSAGQLYDPLGLISPTTLPGKLLIQNAWRYQKEWDESVPELLGRKMNLYCEHQQELPTIRIRRYLGHETGRLVIFSDASRMAQATAAYWVTETGATREEPYRAQLIASKVKLTGLRQMEHIGRLELIAAVMSVLLPVKICIAYGLPLDQVLFFTDSMAVLYWLSTMAPLSVYAGHRVATICERTSWRQWKYVHTKENPSDIPTRGLRARDMGGARLWWEGPEFLRYPPERWPEQPHVRRTEEAAAEERTVQDICGGIILKAHMHYDSEVVEIIRKKRSELKMQIRILKRVFEFLERLLKRDKFQKSMVEVESVFIKHDQRKAFMKLLTELEKLEPTTVYPNLKPFLDGLGMIRIDSGLQTGAAFGWEVQRPILLQSNMPSTHSVLNHTHWTLLDHQNGVEGLLAEARKRFWIIGGRKEAKRIIKECIRCSKKRWNSWTRDLPPLHHTHTNTLRAFSEVGIDHAGPFKLRQGRSTIDAHVLVIACCTTRAVSLKMSTSTGAAHVLAVLQRHIRVFGSPQYINSDQGSGFVRARKLIKQSHDNWRKEGWEAYEALQWVVNPPYSPTWTGHVESLVKLTKRALEGMHQGPIIQTLTYDEFYTLLKRAQGYINSRPLVRPEFQMPILTPGDFIGSGASLLVNVTWRPEYYGNLGYRYQQLEKIRAEVWRVFRESYIAMLRRHNEGPMGSWIVPEEGDLVLAADVLEWSGDGWLEAKIMRAFIGKDGTERLFELQMVPAEELKKEPQMINEKMRLQLKKKVIVRNHRKLGILLKVRQSVSLETQTR